MLWSNSAVSRSIAKLLKVYIHVWLLIIISAEFIHVVYTTLFTMASKRSRKRRRLHDQESQSLESNYQEGLKTAFTSKNKEMAEQLLRDVCSTRRLKDVRVNTILIASVVYIRSGFFLFTWRNDGLAAPLGCLLGLVWYCCSPGYRTPVLCWV